VRRRHAQDLAVLDLLKTAHGLASDGVEPGRQLRTNSAGQRCIQRLPKRLDGDWGLEAAGRGVRDAVGGQDARAIARDDQALGVLMVTVPLRD
jgi:hypothetical protein